MQDSIIDKDYRKRIAYDLALVYAKEKLRFALSHGSIPRDVDPKDVLIAWFEEAQDYYLSASQLPLMMSTVFEISDPPFDQESH